MQTNELPKVAQQDEDSSHPAPKNSAVWHSAEMWLLQQEQRLMLLKKQKPPI